MQQPAQRQGLSGPAPGIDGEGDGKSRQQIQPVQPLAGMQRQDEGIDDAADEIVHRSQDPGAASCSAGVAAGVAAGARNS